MTQALVRTRLNLDEAAACGMSLAVQARLHPERAALILAGQTTSFDALNQAVNQVARALRARGLVAGDGIALLCRNGVEFAIVAQAAARTGLRLTPINWHLTAREARYIVEDCEARAFIADSRFAQVAAEAIAGQVSPSCCMAVGGAIPGFDSLDDARLGQSSDDLDDPVIGTTMLYTSGTTGSPKGVTRPPGARLRAPILVARAARYDAEHDRHLCTGPMYHAAPLAFSLMGPLALGVGIVIMDGWNAEEALALIERERVSHTHMVPTMFHQLLSCDEAERTSRDLSSLRFIVHGAAPCSVALKQRMMDWLGPILYEYYSATEGFGCFVGPNEWLSRPGTVGRPDPGHIEVRRSDGCPTEPGEVGTIFLRAPEQGRFRYFGDAEKTRASYDRSGTHFSLGDLGHFDADGFLFLDERSADLIISGGVNIYPAEIDGVLLEHPKVADAATIGVPHEVFGESVLSVVELHPAAVAGEEVAKELMAHCQERLAGFKCPREIAFSEALPRHETGKILRRLVREHYRGQSHRKLSLENRTSAPDNPGSNPLEDHQEERH